METQRLGRSLFPWAYEVKTRAVELKQQRQWMAQITRRTKGAFRRNGNVISADKQHFHAPQCKEDNQTKVKGLPFRHRQYIKWQQKVPAAGFVLFYDVCIASQSASVVPRQLGEQEKRYWCQNKKTS